MLKKDFWYDLPKELIAQEPAAPRDAARLMVLEREGLSGEEFRVQALECGHRGLTSLVDELGRCHEECPVEEGI